ncbi:pirin-like C-terminal cupin domain-containing protein [uncultured Roseibium sp.]|uniref:pirin family protein n=1 Tax=uncultured Roseibium sp. TaxID=1936171 RepID=UPI0026041B0E|nr:pirin-like C-terminal cupin domain-containing protein [uncultured Roseibium sp.]
MNTQEIDKFAGVTCDDHARSDGRTIRIGDGFEAKSYQHADFQGLMDPLIMVDHFRMTMPTFGTHAHAGLSAVTVVFEDSTGAFHNRDSLGNDVDLAPGDLYWFKAAQGAIHNEAPRPGARTHALQVFVNLAEENRHDAPSAFHLAAKDIPKLPGDRATARLVLGESNGVAGAAAPDIPLTLLDIEIQAGGRFTHQGDSRHHAWILGVKGTSTVSWNESTAELTTGKAIAFAGAIDISFFSAQGAHVVLFRGPPLRQAFVQRGPFAMGNAAELDAVEADYRAGRLGSID